jgi:hypothetical protein
MSEQGQSGKAPTPDQHAPFWDSDVMGNKWVRKEDYDRIEKELFEARRILDNCNADRIQELLALAARYQWLRDTANEDDIKATLLSRLPWHQIDYAIDERML